MPMQTAAKQQVRLSGFAVTLSREYQSPRWNGKTCNQIDIYIFQLPV